MYGLKNIGWSDIVSKVRWCRRLFHAKVQQDLHMLGYMEQKQWHGVGLYNLMLVAMETKNLENLQPNKFVYVRNQAITRDRKKITGREIKKLSVVFLTPHE